MHASYALELQALKTELQDTLARLGVDPPVYQNLVNRRRGATPRSRRCPTRWNRRQLTQEVAAASERRKELERQLQNEIQRQENKVQEKESNRERTAWQTAIRELQQQRAEILRQFEQDTADAAINTVQPQDSAQNLTRLNTDEHQYSINGIVTLNPLSTSQRDETTSSLPSVSIQPVASSAAPVPEQRAKSAMMSILDSNPQYQNPSSTLHDVFSLQLKFAETMLKLEKSVQMRDQLLQVGTSRQRSRDYTRAHKLVRVERRSLSGLSESRNRIRERVENESFSSSACSGSSLDSMPRQSKSIRVRAATFGVSRATTAETLAPSSSSREDSIEIETNDASAPISPAAAVIVSTQEDSSTIYVAGEEEDSHRTPTTGSSGTTPSTGSDQKSNTSFSKQVRFGGDAYSTPVIARRFNFDGPSIDEDDEEEKEQEQETASVLSFLDGSSVSSAELNSATFLRAFARFRRELNLSTTQSPIKPSFATKSFQVSSELHNDHLLEQVASTGTNDNDHTSAFPELDEMSCDELQKHRQQLCLDIQAESAQLVLSYGEKLDRTNTGSEKAEQSKTRLLALREELKATDARCKRRREE